MWISVVPGEPGWPDVVVPDSVWPEGTAPNRVTLKYGAASRTVTVRTRPADAGQGGGPDNPAEVRVAPAVLAGLFMRTEPGYQLKATAGVIEIGPVLGLLLGNRTNWYDEAYLSREPDRVANLARETGGLICAFSPRCYSRGRGCAFGLYYHPGEERWRYGALPLPSVIHRRSFRTSGALVNRLGPVSIFNSRRLTKWELYHLLQADPLLRAHLPETVQVTDGPEVFSLLRRHPVVVLKPCDLSRGRGILFVERQVRRYHVQDYRVGGTPQEYTLSKDEMRALIATELVGRRYLAQQRVGLASVDGSPFDIRVVLQRGPAGDWTEQAIECRLAPTGNLVTNIAHGGRALWLPEAVTAAFNGEVDPQSAEELVLELSMHICRAMDGTGEHFAELGIDLGLDWSGRLWIIEANVIPTFHGFSSLDPACYRQLLAAPLRYGAHRAGFGSAEEGGE